MSKRISEQEAEAAEQEHAAVIRRLEVGWLGRIFGSPKHAPQNIAFFIITLVLISGFVVLLAFPTDRVEYWKLILPVLTLTLGYLFGKNSKD